MRERRSDLSKINRNGSTLFGEVHEHKAASTEIAGPRQSHC